MAPLSLSDATADELLEAAQGGDRASLARLITNAERGGPGARATASAAIAHTGAGYTVGLTGSPGAGKSTLTNALCGVIRQRQESVAVLAIDPSSPYSGGAILGDRVRMSDHSTDDGVYIRSMATRGHLGGLSVATPQAVRVLDAVGFRWIIIETVGVGLVEVEVAGAADTVVVVVNPGWGDAVQANKAGLMEIADVFVINKADRPGSGDTYRDLEQMLSLSGRTGWRPPIVSSVATTGRGVDELCEAVGAHRAHITATGELHERRSARAESELRAIITAELLRRIMSDARHERFVELVADIGDRRIDPWTAALELLPPD